MFRKYGCSYDIFGCEIAAACILLVIIRLRDFFTDINECTLSLDNCHPNSTCTNIDGSFLCICANDRTGSTRVCQGIYKNHQKWFKFVYVSGKIWLIFLRFKSKNVCIFPRFLSFQLF